MVFLGACGKGNSSPKKDTTAKATLKIMTYNIHHGAPPGGATDDIHLEQIAAVINKQQPDLVALQEIDVHNKRSGRNLDEAEELGKLTGMSFFFSKSIDYEGGEYGEAVLSRFPILAKKSYPLPMPDPSGEARSVAVVTVEISPGIKINFASTHLDLASNREAQVKALNGLSKNSAYPLIIGGDFNATPSSAEITTLREEFQLACASGCPLTAPSDKPAKTIDYIVLNPAAAKEFHFISYDVMKGIYASDHLPLIGYLSE
jgi:endonuclease/exonuclease/phosphatase family metal-dependent hydrolase